MTAAVRRVLALVLGFWGIWLWGWAGWSLAAWYGGYGGDTDLRIIAAWFLALGVPPFLASVALWRSWKARAAWVVLGCLALVAFWSQQLAWFSVELVTGLRTGTWSDPLDTLVAWQWSEQALVVPHGWSDLGSWFLWFAWGLWSQLAVALVALVQALRTGTAGGAARRRATAAAERRAGPTGREQRPAFLQPVEAQVVPNTSWISFSRVSPARSTGVRSAS
ncbi:hypothetical protein OO015_11465 [Thermomicrobium sp. 4228-Ro]|uniref:hypothetical protein n=1 Tax=Thermomicrobium sp. 4228-Ro TaxID=2993937 RepID=UPI002248BE2B|nr:hypothetical protein [Thermomicrobium sp. 4228-Ro]MCX2728108.1 hypothetical protein [Thermomicrobium sp. 4228-Ro]